MNVRDALEADADALASIADSPTDVMRNLVHDRTVRVAEDGERAAEGGDEDDGASDEGGHTESRPDVSPGSQYGGSDPEDVLGFVSFDAKDETVHVTQIDGTDDACKRLLDEPIRFADCESMAVEVLLTPEQHSVRDAVDDLGFEKRGPGPRFGETGTIRYRLEP